LPKPDAPVDLASPLAGRWEGVLHSPRGDRSVILVCHPRTDGALDGYLYVHGEDMGPFEDGVYAGDSLGFEIVGFKYGAHFGRTAMTLVVAVAGMSDTTQLRFVSADTTRPAPAPVDLGSPLAGRWVGVLRLPNGNRSVTLVCHPHTDHALDGYLYLSGTDLGPFNDGAWAADSLHFDIQRFRYGAHFDRTTMAMGRSIEGTSDSMALRFVEADTSRPGP
jgi:hypothetical protein